MYKAIRKADKATHQIHVRLTDHEFTMLQEVMESEREYNNVMERKTNMVDALKQGLFYAHMIKCDDKMVVIPKKTYESLIEKPKTKAKSKPKENKSPRNKREKITINATK